MARRSPREPVVEESSVNVPKGFDSDMAKVAAEITGGDDDDDDVDVETANEEEAQALEDFEVPSTRGESDDEEVSSDKPVDSELPAKKPISRLKYTADGEEHEASDEEAVKALSLVKGARRAFSDKAKLQQQVSKLEAMAEENGKFRKYWEEIVAVSSDPQAMWEKMTGKKFSDAVVEYKAREEKLAAMTPEQRALAETEGRYAELQNRVQNMEANYKKKDEELERKQSEGNVALLRSYAEPVFYEAIQKINTGNAQADTRLQKMLWQHSVAELKALRAADTDLTPKVVRKVFEESAAAIGISLSRTSSTQTKAEAEANKKLVAKKAAAAASGDDFDAAKLVKLRDPVAIWEAMSGKAKG